MKVYTAIRICRRSETVVLYCGEDKAEAEEIAYLDIRDEPAPDKHEYHKWEVIESEFPDWD